MSLPRVSSNPHIRSAASTQLIMFAVILALMPAFGYGVYNFGIRALFVVLVCVATSVLSEIVFALITKKKIRVDDLSAVVTGLLLALNLPVSVPFWQAALGSAFAIIVVKELFGGLGKNFMNPALAGRCFLIISFPVAMTNFVTDTYTGATPLALLKAGESVDIRSMVFGNIPGTIGETSVVMILIGACFLLLLGVIDLWVPGSYILSFVIFLILFGGHGFDPAFISAHLAGGGLMLGAFFMATDYVTRPVSKKGQAVFGIFLGIMTGIFRIFGPSAEGVSYAIILGNCLVPLIDKFTVPVPFGLTASEFKKGGK
ncbi:MAG: RnfABCDGE type electron transport complex subunit D [Lachnospiraceae bacterium]|nr:RnfABCDGE type electron transport complex subunit D [Lachnospiraceae bacterium]